ncbi:hypothetical protein EYF80_042404 [Liparis tanakae]|uniref:Uncharacterized protein n=1 Tax=Liparis tanakae TaxID=230148 RepID=A0A4Z2G2B4_9TELE|nr:hypothetical protein EYF80_042404 [Liparis tanakae]
MSVEFAQQIELARMNRRARQRSAAMQTRPDEEEGGASVERMTPGAPLASGAWVEEVAKERPERELEERDAEIRKLKEELRRTESGAEQKMEPSPLQLPVPQALKKREDGQEELEEGEDPDGRGGPGVKRTGGGKRSSEDEGESSEEDPERDVLRKANEKLSRVLVDVLKTTAAAEETMGLHMQSLRAAPSAGRPAAPPDSAAQTAGWTSADAEPAGASAAGKWHEVSV